MADKTPNQRQWRNVWLQPRRQLRYGMLAFGYAAAAMLAVQALTFLSLRREAVRVLEQAGGDAAQLTGIVDFAMRSALLEGFWLFPIFAVGALLGTAHILHSFIGPQVPIRRMIERLRAGEYGTTCRIRKRDKMEDVAAELNDLSATLAERHAAPEVAPRRREAGFSIVEVLVILATIAVISAVAVSQFLRAYDRARQRGTMADMRMVASANGAFYVDEAEYAGALADLEPYYFQPIPKVDRWGYAWIYTSAGKTYELTSKGSDGLPGPAVPTPWQGDPYECDLILGSGAFSQSPGI